jgi:ABC-2 type transport system ATP-binding protein
MDEIVQTDGLSKWYGIVQGLNNVSLTIGPGITGLVGPNGAGKSTFLKLIAGQIKPSQGEARVFGVDISTQANVRARIGYCPEHDGFYVWMTGLEFVRTLAIVGGMAPAEASERALRSLADVGLSADQNRPISTYSKGMRQRVKMAQTLTHDPDLLILDEPLSGTDPVARDHILRSITERAAHGKSVIISSHVLYEIERITSDIVLINKGKVIAQGDIHAIRNKIDEHAHSVILRCAEARRLAAVLLEKELVDDAKVVKPDEILVKTHRPDRFYQSIAGICVAEHIDLRYAQSPDDNLEAVFRYLTT